MPDIVYTVSATVAKGALSQAFSAAGVTANMAASGISTQTISPGTNAATTTAISTATLSSVGVFFARNLSTVSTATVSFGQLSAGALVPCVSLRGGETAIGRLAAGSYAAQSNLTGTSLIITIVEG
ncbi:MAG: hypothetical protein EBQ89_11225 [Alphaproteobacteria bacterium]|nr:hypothetical protein [Alphaproteobacteria bacterium]